MYCNLRNTRTKIKQYQYHPTRDLVVSVYKSQQHGCYFLSDIPLQKSPTISWVEKELEIGGRPRAREARVSNFVCVHRNGSGVAKRSNICTAPHERASRSEDSGGGDGDGGGCGGHAPVLSHCDATPSRTLPFRASFSKCAPLQPGGAEFRGNMDDVYGGGWRRTDADGCTMVAP